MHNDLTIWQHLLQQCIDTTAIIKDDKVMIGETEVPLYDSVYVMKLMNMNPHITRHIYDNWLAGEDDIGKAYCLALHEEMVAEDEQIEFANKSDDIIAGIFEFINPLGLEGALPIHDCQVEPKNEVLRAQVFQTALFESRQTALFESLQSK